MTGKLWVKLQLEAICTYKNVERRKKFDMHSSSGTKSILVEPLIVSEMGYSILASSNAFQFLFTPHFHLIYAFLA